MEIEETLPADYGGVEPAIDPSLSNGHGRDTRIVSLHDDDRSSSLSDIEDGPEHEQLEEDVPKQSQPQTEADSEAETERIDDSPNKLRKQKDIVLSSTTFEKSPSKLIHSVTMEVDGADIERALNGPVNDISSSPLASKSNGYADALVKAQFTETVREARPSVEASTKKRKRTGSEGDASSQEGVEEQPLRKRTGSVKSDAQHEPLSSEEELSVMAVEDRMSLEPAEEDDDEIETITEDVMAADEEGVDAKELSTKIQNTRRGKRKGRKSREAEDDLLEPAEEQGAQEAPSLDLHVTRAENGSDVEDVAEPEEEEDDAETRAKNEEEYAKKLVAVDVLSSIEKTFAALREKLYDERLAAVEAELAQLKSSKPTHPEYLKQLQCVQQYRDGKIDIEHKLWGYKVGTLKKKGVAERSQIHSAYFQTARDIREQILEEAGKNLYRLHHDRFKGADSDFAHAIPFPTKRSTQITQQNAYNKEVSVLSGVAKYVGFPAAPEMEGNRPAEMEIDLEKMGITASQLRATTQSHVPHLRSEYKTVSVMSRPAAEEQFLEQTPWANPQHPVHQQTLQRIKRDMSENPRTSSASFTTPAAQKRVVDLSAPNGSASTIPEHPSAAASSVLGTPQDVEKEHHGETSAIFSSARTQDMHIEDDPSSGLRGAMGELRSHSVSPLDIRKGMPQHTRAVGTGSALPRDVRMRASAESPVLSRVPVLSSPRTSSSAPQVAPPAPEAAPHQASSPLGPFHTITSSHNIPAASGIGRVGAS